MSDTTKACCFLARHPDAAAIDAALRAEDPRTVAPRFGIGKTAAYKHRGHLAPQVVDSASVPPIPQDSAEREGETAPTAEQEAKSSPRAQPQVSGSTGGTAIPRIRGTGYMAAVEHCAEAITRGVMRPAVLQGIAAKLGLSRDHARKAFHEAARHLRLDMGGLLERQEASIAWTLRQRDAAMAKGDAREKIAEDWRRREREAHDVASTLPPEARIAALGDAARFGLTASKYGLEAEKWHAQALNHQRHLDDVQCLLGPKELHLTQNNIGADLAPLLQALAGRLAGRPDLLREIDAALGEIEQGAEVIEATGEAA